jgi:nitrite reductase/ring-hydroxylating ferredoxin subunit
VISERVGAIGRSAILDRVVEPLAAVAGPALSATPVKNALSGTWLGHRVHPLLTDVTLGTLLSATALDVLGGREGRRSAQLLSAIGLTAAVPTAATGLSDWVDLSITDQPSRRVGLVHATVNTVGLLLYAAACGPRRRGAHGAARALSTAGLGALSIGGYLGGHLAYVQGAGVDHTAFAHGPADWTPTIALDDLGERDPRRVDAGGRAVLLYRDVDRISAIDDTCNHAGCSLVRGTVEQGAIVCACHGSTFRLADGELLRGPASSSQPAFDVRVRRGKVEVRARS